MGEGSVYHNGKVLLPRVTKKVSNGDIVGVLLDMDECSLLFFHNEKPGSSVLKIPELKGRSKFL